MTMQRENVGFIGPEKPLGEPKLYRPGIPDLRDNSVGSRLQDRSRFDAETKLEQLKETITNLATRFHEFVKDLNSFLLYLQNQLELSAPEHDDPNPRLRPTMELGDDEPSAMLNFLTHAHTSDYIEKRLSVDEAGWRTLPNIVISLRIPKGRAYGDSRYGHVFGRPLEALIRSGKVEYRRFSGRGRGGQVIKVRVCSQEGLKRNVNYAAKDIV